MMKLMKVVMENQEVNKKLYTEQNKEEENKASLHVFDIEAFEEEVVANEESENQLVSFFTNIKDNISHSHIQKQSIYFSFGIEYPN